MKDKTRRTAVPILGRHLIDKLLVLSFVRCSSSLTSTNVVHTGSASDNIQQIINYYVLLGFLSILCIWIAWTSWIVTAERQIRRIRFHLFRNILRQEIAWFDLHNTGELSSRLIADLGRSD